MKRRDMQKCDRPIKDLGEGEDSRVRGEEAVEANPRGLTYAAAMRYKDFGASEPKPVIFRGICRLQRKSARFSANLNAPLSRIRFPKTLRCSLPSLDKTELARVAEAWVSLVLR